MPSTTSLTLELPLSIREAQQQSADNAARAALFQLLNSPEVAALPRESFAAVNAACQRLRQQYL